MYTITERLRIAWKRLLSYLRREWRFEDYPLRSPLVFAPSVRVEADPVLRAEFLQAVLGFGPDDPVFISDESALGDFGGEEELERYFGLIRSNFGVEVSDLEGARIADILERIAARRAERGQP